VIARIAEAALIAFRKRRLGLEIGAGQIVEQQIETGVEQVAPAARQMIEQRLFVRQQMIVAAIELVDLGQAEVSAEKIGERGPFEPFPVQPPLAARRQQPIGDQHEQFLIPARALAARGQTRGPEPIELQLLPQVQRQPAGAPLARSAQAKLRQPQPNDRGVRQKAFGAIFGKQRQRLRMIRGFVQHLDGAPPRQLLRVVDLAQMQHMLLDDASACDAFVLDDAPVAMPLAVLDANLVAQEHSGTALFTDRAPRK
jgi:hypothetical protein